MHLLVPVAALSLALGLVTIWRISQRKSWRGLWLVALLTLTLAVVSDDGTLLGLR